MIEDEWRSRWIAQCKREGPSNVERRQVNVRLSVPLIEELDARRVESDLSRDDAVARMLRFALNEGPERLGDLNREGNT